MSSSKQNPRPSPSRDVPNVTPGQPGGFIGEQGLISHGPSLVLKRLELSGYVEKLFSLDVTLLNSIGLTAPACLTPADFRPFGEWCATPFGGSAFRQSIVVAMTFFEYQKFTIKSWMSIIF